MTDPYKQEMFTSDPYFAKESLVSKLVVVLTGQLKRRGLQLIKQPSRAICRYQIHELIVTDQKAAPGDTVDPIAYLGFAEFCSGSVLVAGDQVLSKGQVLGTVLGFDETHMPNHLNIVLYGQLSCGQERNLELGQEIVFCKSAK